LGTPFSRRTALWNSYNFLPPHVSNSYALGDTYSRVNGGAYCANLIHIMTARRRRASAVALGIFIRRAPMMDAVMMAIAFVFFALSIAYCYACDRL
jgi:hypothetical protein